ELFDIAPMQCSDDHGSDHDQSQEPAPPAADLELFFTPRRGSGFSGCARGHLQLSHQANGSSAWVRCSPPDRSGIILPVSKFAVCLTKIACLVIGRNDGAALW